MIIRTATIDDAAACAAIYAPYVTETSISFEDVPPTAAEFAARIDSSIEWLIAQDDRPLGYAYASAHAERAAYRWSCDVISIWIATPAGAASAAPSMPLLARMTERGYRMACAGITLPNPVSEGLHRAMGFESVGVYRDIGWKADAWHDVLWLQRPLGEPGPPSREPT